MTLRPLLVALCLAACAPAVDADSSSDIRALTAAFDSAWFADDKAAVGKIMSPAYNYFSSRGNVTPRETMLAWLDDPEYILQASERSEITPAFDGNTAIVSTRWKGNGIWHGEEFVDDQRCSMTWHRAFDGWRLMSEHCTQIVPRDSTG